MTVMHLAIHSRAPHADGVAFGGTGPYERLDGTIGFAVEPGHAANRPIIDLDRAARDDTGRVRFQADFCLLQPREPARGNRRLLFEVLNRGRKLLPRMLDHAPPDAAPTARIDPGDGFLLRHGWTIAWCGWQWDVVRGPALLGLEAPQALEAVDGQARPIEGQVICQFQPNEALRDHLLADRVHRPYPAADLAAPDAVMTVRDAAGGPRATIPRDRWRFARAGADGAPVPDHTRVWLADGFAPGRVYEVVYRTASSPVVGAGLLAVRDAVAFLRHGDAAAGNPCAGRIDHTFGFGMSQSGRFLRHFLYLGLNLDEAGRPVFDGLLPHVAGARRGEFNSRFAQPSVQQTPGFGHLPPFADDEGPHPPAGAAGGLLGRQRALGGVPKIVSINTSAEYWRGDASLAHTDPAGTRDLALPPEVRAYLFAGTQHGLGTVPPPRVNANDGARGAHPFNALDYALLRAALVNLERWVTAGEAPPPSAVPRLADGTAVPARAALDAYRAIPGATLPDPARLPALCRYDLGPDADQGVGRYPAVAGAPYPAYVSAVDADGNEVAGVRMPDLVVPVATYTGWNPRAPESGGTGQIIPMQGSTFPFASDAAARERAGDPRPSVAERYRGRDDYLARVRRAAERLVAERYLLAEDVDLALRLAAERYDYVTGGARDGGETGGWCRLAMVAMVALSTYVGRGALMWHEGMLGRAVVVVQAAVNGPVTSRQVAKRWSRV